MYDVSVRLDNAIDRVRILGKYRTKQVWAVPQAFDDYGDTFWIAAPTGDDVAVQMIVSLNHGASGICPFDAPGSPEAAFSVSLSPEQRSHMLITFCRMLL